jgi:AraC-like DNA-binding protein
MNTFESNERQVDHLSCAADQYRITTLINYIQTHHQEKVTLADIAKSASISRGECCRFFQRMIHMTPFSYLNEYRIFQSVSVLVENNLSITEISEVVGFSSISFYTSTFKKQMKCSPREYRKRYLRISRIPHEVFLTKY